jgi:hypothetical protein
MRNNWRCNLRCGVHLEKEDEYIQSLNIEEKDANNN